VTLFSLTPFFNELDLLEIRLATLDPIVDVHVLGESSLTHSGKPKPLYFNPDDERWAPWAHKIRYLVIDDYPDEPPEGQSMAWTREKWQRIQLVRGLTEEELAGDHMVLSSDLDEIPAVETLRDICARGAAEHIWPPLYPYYLNWRWQEIPRQGAQATCFPMRLLREGKTTQDVKSDGNLSFQMGDRVGWHFTYQGGTEAIRAKLAAFAHEELDDPRYNDADAVMETLQSGRDLFHRERLIVEAPLGDLPKYVQDNVAKFGHMLHHESNPHKRLPVRVKTHPGGTIAIPTNETLRFTDFAQSLTSVHAPQDTKIVWQKGSSIVRNRNALVRTFVGEWLWFMDDDHKFPPTLLWQLLDHEVDVIVPLCLKRYYPYEPVIYSCYREADEFAPEGHVHVLLDEHREGGLIEVYAAGTAGMLVRRHVLEAIGDPWFEDHKWGEDLSFCAKVREAGFKIYCDLDSHLGHISVYTVWPTRRDEQWGMTFDSGSRLGQFFVPTEDYIAAARAQKEHDDAAAGLTPDAKITKRRRNRRVARKR
jgi:beta-1,4-mannosyl-glycoprotein beta-1,4-N-acetylglucosaminyltransferase